MPTPCWVAFRHMVERSGVTRRVVSVILGAVLTMTACSSDDESPSDGTSNPGGGQEVSALEKLSGDQLCDLLTAAAIERELDTTVEESEATERGRAPTMEPPYFLSRECDYETGTFDLSTDVTTEWDERSSDEEVLDDVFTDPTDESEAVGEYERVPDLGAVAGRYLGVVFYIGEERMSLTVHILGKAELPQLRPLAEELLTGVEETLG